MSDSHPLRPALAGFGLVGLLAGAWFVLGSGGSADGAPGEAVAPVAAPALPDLRARADLADPGPGFDPEPEPGVERAKAAADVPPPPITAARDVELRESAKPGVRLVDFELGSPLSFSVLTIRGTDEQSDHRADLRGRVGGVREALEGLPDLLISEPDGTPIEEIEGKELAARLVQGPGGLMIAVECGPSVLVDMGSDRGEPLEVAVLSVGGFGSMRRQATFVGEWEAVTVHRLKTGAGVSLSGVGRVYARAPDSRRVGLGTSGLEDIAGGELHMFDLRPAQALSYRVTRDLQRDERLFVGLTPKSDTEVSPSLWGPEWIGALADPPSPYLIKRGTRVEFEALPTGTYSVELLTNYGMRGTAELETGDVRIDMGEDVCWSSSEIGRLNSMRLPSKAPFDPLRVRFAKDGSLTGLIWAPDGHTSQTDTIGTAMFAVSRDGEESIMFKRTENGASQESFAAPYGWARNVSLQGDFDEGFPAYVLTGGVAELAGGNLPSRQDQRMLETLGYSPEARGLRFTIRGAGVQRALREQTLTEGVTPKMLSFRRLAVSGGGGHDSEVHMLFDQGEAELDRNLTGAVFVYESTDGNRVPWPQESGPWWPGDDARPLAGIEVMSSGPTVRTDLFGLAGVRGEGDDPVEVRLPGLAPIQVGTGKSLRQAPGLLGVPPFDPK